FLFLCLVLTAGTIVTAQTSTITYQGKLSEGSTPANGTYEMQCSLFNALSGPSQIGPTITDNGVSIVNGIFTVQLNFPTSAFDGSDRWLEISVHKAGDPAAFTPLSPRQQITSSPYSLRTLSATVADSLSANCAACVADAHINSVSASKVVGLI